jgi:hypothetical protein
MEMQQMMELLLKMDANQEEMKADRKADQEKAEADKEERKVAKEKAEADRAKRNKR